MTPKFGAQGAASWHAVVSSLEAALANHSKPSQGRVVRQHFLVNKTVESEWRMGSLGALVQAVNVREIWHDTAHTVFL